MCPECTLSALVSAIGYLGWKGGHRKVVVGHKNITGKVSSLFHQLAVGDLNRDNTVRLHKFLDYSDTWSTNSNDSVVSLTLVLPHYNCNLFEMQPSSYFMVKMW